METYALPSPLTGKIIEKKLQMIDEDAERLLTDKDLEGYATETFVTEKIAEAQISGSGSVDLTGYATKTYVNTEINKAKPDLTPYAKKTDIPDVSDFATESFVTEKIAEAQLGGEEVDLSGYATKEYVDDAFEDKEFLPSYDASNEGQFLRIVSGVATWSTITNAEDSTF